MAPPLSNPGSRTDALALTPVLTNGHPGTLRLRARTNRRFYRLSDGHDEGIWCSALTQRVFFNVGARCGRERQNEEKSMRDEK